MSDSHLANAINMVIRRAQGIKEACLKAQKETLEKFDSISDFDGLDDAKLTLEDIRHSSPDLPGYYHDDPFVLALNKWDDFKELVSEFCKRKLS